MGKKKAAHWVSPYDVVPTPARLPQGLLDTSQGQSMSAWNFPALENPLQTPWPGTLGRLRVFWYLAGTPFHLVFSLDLHLPPEQNKSEPGVGTRAGRVRLSRSCLCLFSRLLTVTPRRNYFNRCPTALPNPQGGKILGSCLLTVPGVINSQACGKI